MSPLPVVTEILRAGSWPSGSAVDRIVLNYEERYRRRLRYIASNGTTFLLDLPRAVILATGDGLRLDDGRIVCVEAASEKLVQVTAPDSATLIRLAWHIGNRHVPAQLEAERILIRDDAVIIGMLRGLGAKVASVMAAFTPESGAYVATHGHATGDFGQHAKHDHGPNGGHQHD